MVIKIRFYKFYKYDDTVHIMDDQGKSISCITSYLNPIPSNILGEYDEHIPKISKSGNIVTVKISINKHPMTKEHYIEWICLETTKGYYVRNLKPGEEPEAKFCIEDDEYIVKAYEYCNIHKLWGQRY